MNLADPKLWFCPSGRTNRLPYNVATFLLGAMLEGRKLVSGHFMLVYLPFGLAAMYSGIAIGIKRCHDRGRSGFFLLLNFVPLLNFWPIIELVFLRGTDGPNEYGPDPLDAAPAGIKTMAPMVSGKKGRNKKQCSSCGSKQDVDAAFCDQCGYEFGIHGLP